MESKSIYSKLLAVMSSVGSIGKNKKNSMQGYNFRGIDDMYNALHPLFSEHGIFITSEVLESKREERTTKGGGALIYTILKARFTFTAEDGSSVQSTLEGEAMDSGDKSTNKALSTALKYALMQMFLIPTEEKLDTEYESPEVTPKRQDRPPVSQPKKVALKPGGFEHLTTKGTQAEIQEALETRLMTDSERETLEKLLTATV